MSLLKNRQGTGVNNFSS